MPINRRLLIVGNSRKIGNNGGNLPPWGEDSLYNNLWRNGMLKKTGMALGAAMLAMAGFNAQAGVKAGDVELGVFGSISTPDEGDDTIVLSGNGGYMYTDSLQGKLALVYAESGGVSFGTINPGVDFLFGGPSATTVPYIGGSYALSVGDIDDTDFLNLHVGIKQFISERTSVQYSLERYEAVDSDFSDSGRLDLTVGINFYF